MSKPVAVHVRIDCKPGKREELLKHYQKSVNASEANPGVLVYDVGVPLDVDDGTQVVVFELYTGRDVLDAHLASPDMQIFRGKISELISQMNAKFAAPIGTSFLRSNTNMRPGLTIMAHIQYAESADMEEVLAKGSRLIEYCQLEEQATQSYFWALEAGNPRSILIFEQFKSRDFCFGTHMKTGEFRAATGTQTEGLVAKPTFVSIKFGFQRAMAMNNG